jgi:hypothetical protein
MWERPKVSRHKPSAAALTALSLTLSPMLRPHLPHRLSALAAVFALAALLAACAPVVQTTPPPDAEPTVDADQLISDIRTLAAADMEGRRMGTPGHDRAVEFIRTRFEESGVRPIAATYDLPFRYIARGDTVEADGLNLVGYIPGTSGADRYIVVTAHYDHLGIRDGEIYHGADDNASGTAALFAIARYFADNPPRNSIILAALDAEEVGLRGARAFVADPPVPVDQIALNVNMDMISRNDANELYAAGAFHYPFLSEYIVRTASRAPITLLMGHDDPSLGPREDWTMLSDHGAFHEAGIPFVYFGVEDHDDYHRPTDTFENIQPEFYVGAVRTVIEFLREVDPNLRQIQAARTTTIPE